MKTLMAAAVSLFVAEPALATWYLGTVQMVEVQNSTVTPNATRISISVPSSTTACSNSSFYAFEYLGDNGAGKAWLAGLFKASATGGQVQIFGTGTCDQSNVEIVQTILFYAP